MAANLIALAILLPITGIFAYAGIHEYLRYKNEGKATYGLLYDETSGTTYVTGMAEDQETYDPDDFDPNEYYERRDQEEAERVEAEQKAAAQDEAARDEEETKA